MKDKLRLVGEYIIKHSKIVYPVVLIAVAAFTVTFALSARGGEAEGTDGLTTTVPAESIEQVLETQVADTPLRANEDGAVHTVLATYYNARALGDLETLEGICEDVSDDELVRIQAWSEYIDHYPTFEVYVKDGPEEGSVVAYVYYKVVFTNREEEVPGYQAHYICTNEQGELYIRNTENCSDEVIDYLLAMQAQDDVVEFNNRINVEYNEMLTDNQNLASYMAELADEVDTSVGVLLAQRVTGEGQTTEGEAAEGSETAADTNPAEGAEGTGSEAPAEQAELYGTATTTVNVRASDSELADRLGKATGGLRLQVLEQRANGWSKVLFEGQEGYIKSEYIQMETAAGAATTTDPGTASVGTVTATTNINIRSSASESGDKLGVLVGGDTAELLSENNGWCQIRYNGLVGFVKSEFVQK